ncbi:Uncharacterized conserved protein, DUF1499 family [Maridesulfovibrio ferrireducens]|uniref:Uncharacterized conserved protein, DUF1499 family n=1 Tax=Maridesulfovibrio ferrireducens TaxID=246191 RepID=A0A1G9J7R0_9BACT|nr:DUF1499 domain-containing protein [Maridesulfovibrio ferrireducens]SDL33528.1 Uncharacterized conserved protein, DUF1499 family [Maridesulfovibrio ferrireducens]
MTYKLIILCVLAILAVVFISACSANKPKNLGITNGKFSACPSSPNCVSSQASDENHKIAPLKAHGELATVMANLKENIKQMDGSKVIKLEGAYLHAEFTSNIMRFVDDLECFYDKDNNKIEVRSASRIGYSDFSANRKRIETLRTIFEKKQ